MGYRPLARACNHLAPFARVAAAATLALMASGCSLTMQLAAFNEEPETTASISPNTPTRLDASLDDEDWRRAQAALSLAVDPQGPGLPVNWDNPISKRKGSFAAAGDMMLVQNTVCRPFKATLVQPGGKESKQTGQACRLGPSEWAMRLDVAPDKKDALDQPLPARAGSLMSALEKAE